MNDRNSISEPDSVSVVIATYHRHDTLKNVLKLFEEQTTIPYEFIIVDQTPDSHIPNKFYDNFKLNIKLIKPKKPSMTGSRNIGAAEASGEYLLIIDDDILFEKDYVENYLKVLKEENVDVVNGGTTLEDKLPEDWPWPIEKLDPVRFFLAAPNHQWQGMQLSISSTNFIIRKDIWDKSGGFDIFCPRMADFEFGYRLYKMGAKIYYSPLPWCKHLRAGGGLRKNPFKNAALVGSLYIHKKHFPGWISRQYIVLYLLRLKVLYRPWIPIKLLVSYYKANKLLKEWKRSNL